MTARYVLSRLLYGALLVLGVTFLGFLLMVHFGPDQTYQLLGKNPGAGEVAELRAQLGYDRPFLERYARFLGQLARLDLGHSQSSGEPVTELLRRAVPVTIMLVLPGFLIGNLAGLGLGMVAAWNRGGALDRLVMAASVTGMSLSFLVIIIVLQVLLCTPWGVNLFPARGWQVTDAGSYLYYVTVPTLALVLVTLGYNARFYRAVLVEELGRDHVRTVRAFGGTPAAVLYHVFRNGLAPILTRFMFSLPMVLISGSLLLETYFGIPGVGRATFDAITSGDQPVLKAVVCLTAVLFVGLQLVTDLLYRAIDPRVAAP